MVHVDISLRLTLRRRSPHATRRLATEEGRFLSRFFNYILVPSNLSAEQKNKSYKLSCAKIVTPTVSIWGFYIGRCFH